MAWWTEKDALNEQIRLLRKEIKAKDEQIAEMQLLINKANEKLKVHFSDVVSSFEPTDEQIRQASYKWCESEYGNIEPHSIEGSRRRKYFKSAIKWFIGNKKIIGENVR